VKPLPPGPPGHLFLGHLPDLRRDPLGFLTRCAREYGDVVRYRIVNAAACLVNRPEYVDYVLASHGDHFVKGRVVQASRAIWGNGLLASEGAQWKRHRRLVMPAFHRERIEVYGEIGVGFTERMLATWQPGVRRDIHKEMKRLTLEIIAKALFDADIADDAATAGEALRSAWDEFSARLTTALLIPDWLPTPGNIRMRNAVRRLDAMVDRIINERREQVRGAQDLLGMLLQAKDEDGSELTNAQLRDEIKTLFVAGHETTALALTWSCYLLACNPTVESTLRDELRQVLGHRVPALADLPRLRYTESVIKESLRLYPTVWALPRMAQKDCEIGGYTIPAGTSVTVSQWVMHRDPRYFANPDSFQPERWFDPLIQSLPRYAYFPFGGGPRHCLGHALAMMEATLLLASLVSRFHLELAPDQTITPFPSITLYPRTGLQMIVQAA
jgi:cytochrome P450